MTSESAPKRSDLGVTPPDRCVSETVADGSRVLAECADSARDVSSALRLSFPRARRLMIAARTKGLCFTLRRFGA
jgi:hypothetical protein